MSDTVGTKVGYSGKQIRLEVLPLSFVEIQECRLSVTNHGINRDSELKPTLRRSMLCI